MGGPHLVIHGHFYQPPRENPWTEVVPPEPSAAPFHDWNERISVESYRPNAHARIVDDHGRLVAIVNDYELLSFNVGATLTSWLDEHAPDVLERIRAADARAGTAMAQAYNHPILPLCNERDLRTQIRWGVADFRHRFGREPDGFWLPETAVNDAVLAALVEEGLRFTILAPTQAAGTLEPGRPYRWDHPEGRGSITLAFYDGPLSHDIAFSLGSRSAAEVVERAASAAPPDGLALVATDGETFGHHHKFAERAVAYALAVEAPRRGLTTGSLGAWLAEHPPTATMGVRESAWSCAHGLGRWRDDCGCSTGGPIGWVQTWRAPLRTALDLLHDHAAAAFDTAGRAHLYDPWVARDAYVDVVLGTRTAADFCAERVRPGGDAEVALALLEAQRHALLMYTSCGWFFYDLAGIETVQVLRYAARCLDNLSDAGDDPPTEAFLEALDQAESNDPQEGSGRQVWARHVVPARVDGRRVVAHLALVELLDGPVSDTQVGGFDLVEGSERRIDEHGALTLASGCQELRDRRTGRRRAYAYAALKFGPFDVVGACRPADAADGAAMVAELRSVFTSGERLTALLRRINDGFGEEFGLDVALPGAAEALLGSAMNRLSDRFAGEFARLLADHRPTFTALAAAGASLPAELRAPAELVLYRQLEADLADLALEPNRLALRAAEQTVREAQYAGISLAGWRVRKAATEAVVARSRAAVETREPDDVDAALAVVRLATRAGLDAELTVAQEIVYDALVGGQGGDELQPLADALGLAVGTLGVPR